MNVSGWKPGIPSRYGAFGDLGYGHQWWSYTVGDHQFHSASGHGGNFIIILDNLDMIIVTTAFAPGAADVTWPHEQLIVDIVGEFIKSLPEA